MNKFFFRIFISTVLLGAIRPAEVSAQILQTDIISSFQKTDTTAPLIALFQIGFSVEQQLNTVYEFETGSDLLYNFSADAIVLAAKAKLTYAGDLRVTNSGYGHLRYLFRRREQVGFDLFTQFQWDGPRGMKNRSLLGGNLRLNVRRDSMSSTDVAAGLMYEHEEWNYSGVKDEEKPADLSPVLVDHPRINTYVRYYRRFGPGVDMLLMNYVQTRLDEHFVEPRIATAVQLGFTISSRFSYTVSYNSIYDFAPIVPIRRFYFTLSNNLRYRI